MAVSSTEFLMTRKTNYMMTKKELIEILNQLNDDDTVWVAVITEHCAKVHPIAAWGIEKSCLQLRVDILKSEEITGMH